MANVREDCIYIDNYASRIPSHSYYKCITTRSLRKDAQLEVHSLHILSEKRKQTTQYFLIVNHPDETTTQTILEIQ